jgi:hypothetical protein
MSRFSNVVLVASVIASSVVATPKSQAWHPPGCGFGASYLSTWGAYGMGGGFRHSGFGSCYSPSYMSFAAYQPRYVSFYRPIVCAPRFRCATYWPTTCWQTPTYFSSFNACYPYSSPSYYGAWSYSSYYPTYSYGSYDNGFSYSSGFNNPTKFVSLKPTTSAPELPHIEPTARPNESWVVLAVEMIDSMAQKGGVNEGLSSCEQLIRVKQGLPAEVYWRAAVLASLAGRDSKQVAQYMDLAEQAPGRFSPSLLPGGSLRGYVKRIPGQSFDNALNRHARTALTDSQPMEAYRVLSRFLNLDGQSQRAEKFALAAKKALPATNTKTTTVLLTATDPVIEPR